MSDEAKLHETHCQWCGCAWGAHSARGCRDCPAGRIPCMQPRPQAPAGAAADDEAVEALIAKYRRLAYRAMNVDAWEVMADLRDLTERVEQQAREREAEAWRVGVVTALDFATRNEDGVTLSLDPEAHPNPYRADRGGDRG